MDPTPVKTLLFTVKQIRSCFSAKGMRETAYTPENFVKSLRGDPPEASWGYTEITPYKALGKYEVKNAPSFVTQRSDGFSVQCMTARSRGRYPGDAQNFWTHHSIISRGHLGNGVYEIVFDESSHHSAAPYLNTSSKLRFGVTQQGHICITDASHPFTWTYGMYCDEHNRLFWPTTTDNLLERILPPFRPPRSVSPAEEVDMETYVTRMIEKGYTPLGSPHGIPQFVMGG